MALGTKSVADILRQVQRNISVVAGEGVQGYGEDSLLEKIRTAYIAVLESRWWDHLMRWEAFDLAGDNGVVTADLATDESLRFLNEYTDIRQIRSDRGHKILEAPDGMIPYDQTGDEPVYRKAYDNEKLFRIIPYTAIGRVHVEFRRREPTFDLTTKPNLDDILIGWIAAHDYLSDDAANPGAAQKAAERAAEREKRLMLNQSGDFSANECTNDYSGLYEWR